MLLWNMRISSISQFANKLKCNGLDLLYVLEYMVSDFDNLVPSLASVSENDANEK